MSCPLSSANTERGVPIFRQSSRSFCVNDSSYKTANTLHKCMFVLLLGLSPSVGPFQRAGWPSSFLWHVKLLLSSSQMMSFLLLTCGRPDVSRSSLQFLSGHVTLSLCRDDSLTFTGRSSLCSVAFCQDFIVFLKVVKFTNELDRHTEGDEAEDLWIALGWLWVFSYFCASKCIPAVSEGSEAERPTAHCELWAVVWIQFYRWWGQGSNAHK